MAETNVAVSLLLAKGKGYNIDYLIQGREVDISHKTNKFAPGEYPFYWPGNVALFGGHLESNETPEAGFLREMKEELPDLQLDLDYIQKNMAKRKYHYQTDVPRILAEANEVFQGNVAAFFGNDLNAPIPSCALGKDRKMYRITYKEWLAQREDDYYFAMNIGENIAKLRDQEGAGATWLPHWVARSICTVPCDKIALLDDMVQRVKSGELEIKVIKK